MAAHVLSALQAVELDQAQLDEFVDGRHELEIEVIISAKPSTGLRSATTLSGKRLVQELKRLVNAVSTT